MWNKYYVTSKDGNSIMYNMCDKYLIHEDLIVLRYVVLNITVNKKTVTIRYVTA